ncbi:MAG TPA: choice-of-anchor D domain-containing protein [Syntrophomonadaceae bacterium]|nr:choice-of-anchor D domain-containing protein [Syntrophomonadaceae bacterium]
MGNRIRIVLFSVFLLFTFLLVNPVPVMASEPVMKVTCNGQGIIIGDTPPRVTDNTSFVGVTNDDPNESPYTSIQGTGGTPETPGTPEISIAGNGIGIVHEDATPSAADNTDFGTVKIGEYADKTFTITNTGTADLNIAYPGVSVSRDTNFSVITQPGNIVAANGGNTTFTIRFTPIDETVRIATISIASDDSDENAYTFDVKGNGFYPEIHIPEISVTGNGNLISNADTTPNTADNTQFGNIEVGESIAKTFSINNTGKTDLILTGDPKVSISGSINDFTVITQPHDTIAAGDSTTFEVRFTPSQLGDRIATINIDNNDLDENPYDYQIQGTGINEPAVVSLAATEITNRSAVLRGTVKANYGSTTVTFEYGRDTDYGTTVTADQSPVTGGGITWVTRTISGLTPSTTYHFRINGFNSTGESNGTDRTFTTAWSYDDDDSDISYPTVSTDAADSLSSSSAVLNGRISSRGGNAITNYGFYYSTDKGNWIKVKAGSDNLLGDFSYRLTGLEHETTYYYKAYAVNYRGTSYGVVRSFTTAWSYDDDDSDVSYPTVLTDSADSLSSSSAVLNGRISLRGGKAITNYGFYYSTDKKNWTKVKAGSDNLLGDFSYRLTGLKPETTYYYKAYAVNYRGTSYGVVRSFTTAEKYEQAASKVIMRFYVGKNYYYVNDRLKTMNTSPIISGSRTLLPIRYVAEALGANVGWEQNDQRVTIIFKNKTLILWIGHKAAVVNGEVIPIDQGNSNTTPIIISGRCMLPLRFVSEALGCQVDWNANTQEIKVVYP